MNEMLLLGAGASIEADVPGAYLMTEKISARIRANPITQRHAHVISFAIGGLLFEAGKSNQDPLTAGVNVEDLFNAVQLLADRHSLEAAPFVGSWHAMVEELDRESGSFDADRLNRVIYKSVTSGIQRALSKTPPGYEARKIDEALKKAVTGIAEAVARGRSGSISLNASLGAAVEGYLKETADRWSNAMGSNSPSMNFDLEREMSNFASSVTKRPGEGRIFQATNDLMIGELKNLVWIEEPSRVAYLNPIFSLLQRQKRLVVVTLNYDNAVELAAGTVDCECDTGIDKWSSSGTFNLEGDGLFLLKLHGSIDWIRQANMTTADRPMQHSLIRKSTLEERDGYGFRPAVIFGQRNKLTAEGPFLELLRAFQRELSRTDTLTVVGYSFRDPHINVFISQWLNADRNHRLRIVNGPNPYDQKVPYLRELASVQSAGVRVEFTTWKAGEGLKELYGDYEAASTNSSTSARGMDAEAVATGAVGTASVGGESQGEDGRVDGPSETDTTTLTHDKSVRPEPSTGPSD